MFKGSSARFICFLPFVSMAVASVPSFAQEQQQIHSSLPIDGLKRIRQEKKLSKEFVKGFTMVRQQYSLFTPYGMVEAVSPHPVRNGKASLRVELRQGDCGTTGTYDDCHRRKDRLELSSDHSLCLRNTRSQFGWSIFFPTDWNINDPTQSELIIGQFHAADEDGDSTGPTAFEFGYGNGMKSRHGGAPGLVLRRRVDLDEVYKEWRAKSIIPEEELRGRWHDIRIDAYWRTKKDGYFKVSVDGKPVYDFEGPTIEGRRVYLKLGVHRLFYDTKSPNLVMYYDDIWKK